jgi:hypothetical protein
VAEADSGSGCTPTRATATAMARAIMRRVRKVFPLLNTAMPKTPTGRRSEPAGAGGQRLAVMAVSRSSGWGPARGKRRGLARRKSSLAGSEWWRSAVLPFALGLWGSRLDKITAPSLRRLPADAPVAEARLGYQPFSTWATGAAEVRPARTVSPDRAPTLARGSYP